MCPTDKRPKCHICKENNADNVGKVNDLPGWIHYRAISKRHGESLGIKITKPFTIPICQKCYQQWVADDNGEPSYNHVCAKNAGFIDENGSPDVTAWKNNIMLKRANKLGHDSIAEMKFEADCKKALKAGFKDKDGNPDVIGWRNSTHRYLKFRKDYCENIDGRLGVVCTTTVMCSANLTVDHINGNNRDDTPGNHQTFCQCCHTYKTFLNGDNKSPGVKTMKHMSDEEAMKYFEAYNVN